MKLPEVTIIGAGLSGLTAAHILDREGVRVTVYEKEGRLGGQATSDIFEGFTLDRGFHIFLTEYPECKKLFDYPRLGLGTASKKVLVRFKDEFVSARRPFTGLYKFGDRLRVYSTLRRLKKMSFEQSLNSARKSSAHAVLKKWKFSDHLIDHVFRPFLGGVLMDKSLKCQGDTVPFLLKVFNEGDLALPAGGILSLADQLAARLPSDSLRLNHQVNSLEEFSGKNTILAVDPWSASKLLDLPRPPPGRKMKTYYFSAHESPLEEGSFLLNPKGVINHLCVVSNINPSYAPHDKHLIAVNILEDELKNQDLYEDIQGELLSWFGESVLEWRLLHSYLIENAQPTHYPLNYTHPNIIVAGAYKEFPSIESAVKSGRLAAETMLARIKKAKRA